MAHTKLAIALGLVVAAGPAWASLPEPAPERGAPPADANARYCMRIEAVTGSRLEQIRCWTRQEWADQGVDVDKEWSREGVAVLR